MGTVGTAASQSITYPEIYGDLPSLGEEAPSVEIFDPAPGGVSHTNETVTIGVRATVPPDSPGASLSVSILRDDADSVEPVSVFRRTRDLQTGQSVTTLSWDPGDSGAEFYALEAMLNLADRSLKETVLFRVVRPPRVDLVVKNVKAKSDRATATLVANAVSPDGVPIREYRWRVGDAPEVVTRAPLFTLEVSAADLPVSVWLTAIDALAGKSQVLRIVRAPLEAPGLAFLPELFFAPIPPEPSCACKHMTVRAKLGESSGIYCFPGDGDQAARPDFFGCEKVDTDICKEGQVGLRCGFDPLFPASIGRRQFARLLQPFEVTVKLMDKSTAGQCDEGQFVKATAGIGGIGVRNTKVADQPLPDTTFMFPQMDPDEKAEVVETVRSGLPAPPADSGFWGGDNYHTESRLKVYEDDHSDRQIRWLDPSGLFKEIPTALAPITFEAQYLAFVRPKDGEDLNPVGQCWCKFGTAIALDIDRATGTLRQIGFEVADTGKARFAKIGGLNCTVDAD